MNLPPSKQSQKSSNNEINNEIEKDSNKKKSTKKRTVMPKTHNHQFSMQSIIDSVAGIGLGSANDFSFADFGKKDQTSTAIENIATTEHSNSPLDESIIDPSVEVENNEHPSNISNTPIPNKPVSTKNTRQIVQPKTTQKNTASISNKKRNKKINRAKLHKVFKTQSFRHTHSTTKVMGGLVKLAKEVDQSINAKEFVSELLIKWIIKEKPILESKILQLLDQHLDQG